MSIVNLIKETEDKLPNLFTIINNFNTIYEIHDINIREEVKQLPNDKTREVAEIIRNNNELLKDWTEIEYSLFQSLIGTIRKMHQEYQNQFALDCALSSVNVVIKNNL